MPELYRQKKDPKFLTKAGKYKKAAQMYVKNSIRTCNDFEVKIFERDIEDLLIQAHLNGLKEGTDVY